MVCDANGVPLRFILSAGQASDIAHAQPLLDQVRIPGKPGRPRKRSRWLLADKGYDAEHLRQYCDRYRMQPVIPLRAMPRKPRPGLPRLFDRPKYRQRNIIERMFGWLKENRRIGTRYDKLARSFAAMVTLACSLRCMRQYFSYKTYNLAPHFHLNFQKARAIFASHAYAYTHVEIGSPIPPNEARMTSKRAAVPFTFHVTPVNTGIFTSKRAELAHSSYRGCKSR